MPLTEPREDNPRTARPAGGRSTPSDRPRGGPLGSVLTVPETYRALDLLARRHDGESAAFIAQHAGVSEAVVLRATDPYGPFPRPHLQLGRTIVDEEVLTERTGRWVEARRRGQSSTAIARVEGVSRQLVSRVTRDHGTYPAPEVVEARAEARRAGESVEAIGASYGVRGSVIRRHTAPFGPFVAHGNALPDGSWASRPSRNGPASAVLPCSGGGRRCCCRNPTS